MLVSDLSLCGRSTQDPLATLYRLAESKVSVVAMNGMAFELDSPSGRMMAATLAGIAQFERNRISERVKSWLAAAKARGKKLGRQPAQQPISDKLAPKVLQAVSERRSFRWIARELEISRNTVLEVARRHRQAGKICNLAAFSIRSADNHPVNAKRKEDRMLRESFRPLPESTRICPSS